MNRNGNGCNNIIIYFLIKLTHLFHIALYLITRYFSREIKGIGSRRRVSSLCFVFQEG